jgi:hypothetical protein
MRVIIVDLDNCVSDDKHRRHFLEKEPKDWDSYLDSCHQDSAHPWAVEIIDAIILLGNAETKCGSAGARIAFVSGRMERVRQKTIGWIMSKFLFESEKEFDLYLRKDNDFRKAWIFKEEVVQGINIENDIVFAMDDDTEIAKMYERNGITCLVPWNQKR